MAPSSVVVSSEDVGASIFTPLFLAPEAFFSTFFLGTEDDWELESEDESEGGGTDFFFTGLLGGGLLELLELAGGESSGEPLLDELIF
jgi:hypothetical protein